MESEERYREIIQKLASDTQRWLEIKKELEATLIAYRSIIEEIDQLVISRELNMTRLQ
jgi:hypothetical protein